MLNRIGSAIRNGASTVYSGISKAWEFAKSNAPKAGKFIKENVLPSSVSSAKIFSGDGQAIFNQDRFDHFSGLSENSSWSNILKIAGIIGSTGTNIYTRLPSTFELFRGSNANPEEIEESENIGFFKRLFRFFFPPDLGIKGKLIYLFLLPINIFSVLMQSVGILGFSKSFLIYLIKNISHLFEYQFNIAVQPIDEDKIIHDHLFTAMCLYLLIANGINNAAFDLRNAVDNAHKIADSIETSNFNCTWSMGLTGVIGGISIIAVPFLAQVSTYNNLTNIPIPGIVIPETAKIAISWTSAFSAFINHLTAKIPSTYRTFSGGLPQSQPPVGCSADIAMKLTFYPPLIADSIITALANTTAVANGIVTRIKQINPDFLIQNKDTWVLVISVLCGGSTGLVSGLYSNEAFMSLRRKMYPVPVEETEQPDLQIAKETDTLTSHLDNKNYGSIIINSNTLFAQNNRDVENGATNSSKPIRAQRPKRANGKSRPNSFIDSTRQTTNAINIVKRRTNKDNGDRHIVSLD